MRYIILLSLIGLSAPASARTPLSEGEIYARSRCQAERPVLNEADMFRCLDWRRAGQDADMRGSQKECAAKEVLYACVKKAQDRKREARTIAEQACGGYAAHKKDSKAFTRCFDPKFTEEMRKSAP